MLVESDYKREYRIDLSRELGSMSWRRFAILLRGLGPHSASATRASARKYARTSDDPAAVPMITDPEKARTAFSALFPPGVWGSKAEPEEAS